MDVQTTNGREPVIEPAPPARGRSPWPWVLLALVLIPLLGVVILAAVTFGGLSTAWHAVDNLFAGRMVLKPDPAAVILQVRDLGRLETSGYTVEKIVEGGKTSGSPVLDLFVGDRLLFIAHGDVVAGVDLTQLGPDDVTVSSDGHDVVVRLPAAQILSHRLDNDQSRIYDRQTGVLARGDPQLETQVRQEAERLILQAACQGGILKQADGNAQQQVRTLLLLAHFNQVQFLPGRPVAGDNGCEPGF